jgi:WD40 repeat protein
MGRSGHSLTPVLMLAVAVAAPACVLLWRGPSDHVVVNVAFAPDGRSLATFTGHDSGRVLEVRVWDLLTARERRSERQVYLRPELVVAADGRSIAANTPAGLRPLRELATWPGLVLLNFFRRRLAPDGRILATAQLNESHFDRIQLWDVATGTLAAELTDGQLNDAMAFSPDSKTLAAVRSRMVLWDVTVRKVRASPTIGASCMSPVEFAPDGSLIASQANRAMSIWDSTTGAVRVSIPMPDMARCIAFDRHSRRLAIGMDDRVTLHDLLGLRPTVVFRGHVESPSTENIREVSRLWGLIPVLNVHNSVNAVAFSPDETLIASGDTRGIVRVWDAATARERLVLLHQGDGAPAWAIVAAGIWAGGWVGGTILSWRRRSRLAAHP